MATFTFVQIKQTTDLCQKYLFNKYQTKHTISKLREDVVYDPPSNLVYVDCLEDVKAWLAMNCLSFNDSKTEVMVFKPSNSHTLPPGFLGPLKPFKKQTVTNLGVKIDSDLKMDKQINEVVRKSFLQLRRLSKVKILCISPLI